MRNRKVYRRLSSAFDSIHVRSRGSWPFQQHLAKLAFACARRPMKGGSLALVLSKRPVKGNVLAQQQLNYVGAPVTIFVCCQVVEDVSSTMVLLIHVCTAFEQHVHDVPIVLPCSCHERSAALLVLRVNIASEPQQQLQKHRTVLFHGRQYRRYSASWRTIRLRTTFQQVFSDFDARSLDSAHQPNAQQVLDGLRLGLGLLDYRNNLPVTLFLDRTEEQRFDTSGATAIARARR